MIDLVLNYDYLQAVFPVAAAVLGGASLLGSLLSSSSNKASVEASNEANLQSTRETNAANEAIAREANEYNRENQRMQNEWNMQQWLRENEYNSPSAQVERLKEAGINPYSVFNGGSVTPASSLQSAPSAPAVAPQMQSAHFESYIQDPNAFSNAFQTGLNAFVDAKLKNATADKTYNDTQISSAREARDAGSYVHQIQILANQAKGSGLSADIAKEQLALLKSTMSYRVAEAMNNVTMMENSINESRLRQSSLDIANKLQAIQLRYAPTLNDLQVKQLESSLSQVNAEIRLINSQSSLTSAQRDSEIQKRVGLIIDNGMKAIDKDTKEAVQSYIIRDYKYGSESRRKDADRWKIGPFEFSRPARYTNHW